MNLEVTLLMLAIVFYSGAVIARCFGIMMLVTTI